MKKILYVTFALLIIGAIAVSFCACGGGDNPSGRNGAQTTGAGGSDVETGGADTAGATTEEAVTAERELTFIERVSGSYDMYGKAVYQGDENHYYTDSGTNELNVNYTVTVKAGEDGKADVNINYGEGSNDEVGEIDEDSKTITFTTPYAFGYYYQCTLTFDDGGGRVFAQLHMHCEGENWEGKAVSEDIDLEGYSK